MNLRLPESSSLLGTMLSNLGRPVDAAVHGSAVDDATDTQLGEALDAMARAEIEFVILEHGEAFIQAAGEGDGPYQLQYRDSESEPLMEFSEGANRSTVAAVLRAYLRGDRGWRGPHAWIAADE